mmetsp:Transcript_6990/g.13024  ORF Transcript_6990/g.13024 Transcript_6990/m.13024 type:complete len:203 (-) Transcript_6990:170-778(-)
MATNPDDNDFTLVMIGDAGVGKTALLLRFADDQFLGDYMPTVGVDFRYRKFDVDGKRVKLQIWDTAGQERFRTMTASYYRGAHGVVLVYDITNKESFEHVQGWMKSVDKYGREGVIRMVIGNKCDIESEREVQKEDLEAYAENNGVMWIETSAKSSANVNLAFKRLATRLLESQKFRQNRRETKSNNISLQSPTEGDKKRCC